MSDFDDLLERLLLDPEFKAALAADPDRILAGYHLDPEQRRVLLTQVSTETGAGLKVEERISKAGMAGLLSAFSEGAGGGMAQHTMKGVHLVAPTSAHGATISAGAVEHAIASGAPTPPPPPSMANAIAALQEALHHAQQGGSKQGAMANALQNAVNQLQATQGASNQGSSHQGSSQGAMANALQNLLNQLHAAQGAPNQGSSQGAMANALQNALNHIQATQTGGHPAGSVADNAAAGGHGGASTIGDYQQTRGGSGTQAIGPDRQDRFNSGSRLEVQPKSSEPTKVDGVLKGTAETKGPLGTADTKGHLGTVETKGHLAPVDQGGSSGQHYYDQHGRPITSQQAADLEAHHLPVYHHLDAKGQPISDQAFNAHYPNLAQYQAAAQHGTHFYDDHGHPLTPEQAAQYEAQHHHPPIYHHLDAKGQPITDEAFNKRYTHLDHYKSAYAQGTRFYDDHGTPLNPEQAAQYEAQHHHAPAEHVDAKGHPMTNEQWAKYQDAHYPHLDHYKSAYAQGTRFYDDHGTPLNPEQAAQYEAQHHHAPAEHVDAKGHPMTNEQWAKYVATHSPKGADVPGSRGVPASAGSGTLPPPTGIEHQQAR